MSRSTEEAKKRAAIYRKAARRIERAAHGMFSCSTLNTITGDGEAARRYAELFRPEDYNGECWGHAWANGWDQWRERNACRIVALCFMAAMVEAGDA